MHIYIYAHTKKKKETASGKNISHPKITMGAYKKKKNPKHLVRENWEISGPKYQEVNVTASRI